MQLAIRHETVYQYTAPQGYTIQLLRLTPRSEAHQPVVSWSVSSCGTRNEYIDAYGNHGHVLTITKRHQEVRILASGVVDVVALDRGRLEDQGSLSPLLYTVPTRLTLPNDAILGFTDRNLPARPGSADLLALAQAICDAVTYQSGATLVSSTAADALRLGCGVCQDHAHLFLSCCHARGIPARYVSGYIDPGPTEHAASHAWVDVWVRDRDYTGWISIDVTHASLVGDDHCRLAIGRDYDSAGPLRGVRHGGGEEYLSVDVQVTTRPLTDLS